MKSDDYAMNGNWYSDDYNYLIIKIKPCNSATNPNCKSQAEIEAFISDKYLEIIMVDKFFKADDFEDPIGSTITDKYYYRMLPGYTKQTQIYIKENRLELMDSFFQYESYDKHKYYSISGGTEDVQTFKDNSYIVTYFMLDSEVTTYRRTVFSFLDMFAQIGGVYQVVRSIMFLFIGFYAERMMYYCVLRK